MKNSSILALGFTLALLSVGCSKTSEVQPPVKSDTFEEQLITMLPILDEHHVLVVKYSSDQAGGQSIPLFYFMPREADQSGSRNIVCTSSSGVTFAHCCHAWLEDNPGKCLKVWEDDKGVYYADDNC